MKRTLLLWLAGGLLGSLPVAVLADGPNTGCTRVATSGDNWSEVQRRADPDGYFQFVRHKLEQETAELTPVCDVLKQDIARQNAAIQAKMDLWRKAKEVADKARQQYQQAEKDGQWPVEVCGVLYCKEQLLSQVSMLMEEAKGLAECVTKMKAARERAEAKLEELTVRKTRVESQVSIATTLHELWKASQLRSDGERMLACLEQLIVEEPLQLAGCPLRTTDGFPAIPDGVPQPHRNFMPVVRYLQNSQANGGQQPVVRQHQTSAPVCKPHKKPIFVQN
jgi:hypothetical protein